MNKKIKVTKRIVAWFMCLAMVLTTINLPVFTTEVKAATVDNVSYIDENGGEKIALSCIEIESDSTTWNAGWYVVSEDVTISDRITVNGEVHLILADGATLTASKGITVSESANFNVYAQSTDEATMGKLIATAESRYNAGIGGSKGSKAGEITINGGNITAIGYDGAGIGSGYKGTVGTITINDGVIDAKDNYYGYGYGAGIGGGRLGSASVIDIKGGVIQAKGIGMATTSYGNPTCGNINIYDGVKRIIVTSKDDGIGLASSSAVTFYSGSSAVEGDEKDAVFYDVEKGGGREIRSIAKNHLVTIADVAKASVGSVAYAYAGELVTLTLGTAANESSLTVSDGTNNLELTGAGDGKYTFVMPEGDVTVTADVLQTYSISLPTGMKIIGSSIAADGNGTYMTGTKVEFKPSFPYSASNVSDGVNTLTATDGVYSVVVDGSDITITADVQRDEIIDLTRAPGAFAAINGDVLSGSTSYTVHIADGATITLSGAIINGGIVCDGSATIILERENTVKGATNMAGIQVGGEGTTLTIKGNGSLTATGYSQSAGIGLSRAWNLDYDVVGGDVVIEGGNITAQGGSYGAGIGTGILQGSGRKVTLGNITIKGGTVKAIDGKAPNGEKVANGIGTGDAYPGCTNEVGEITIYDDIVVVDASSISKDVTYMHDDIDVSESKNDYFNIIENGERKIIYTGNPISDIEDQTYTGEAITPKPTVSLGSLNFIEGVDYEYLYTNNVNVGSSATVTVTFKGDYAEFGSVSKSFNIVCDHSLNENAGVDNEDGTHDITCSVCNDKFVDDGNHNFSEEGICDICGLLKPNYLTFTALQDESRVTFKYASGSAQYSRDGGENWSDCPAGTRIDLKKDESVCFKGKNIKTDVGNHFAMLGKIKASGSVTSLTDENGSDSNVVLEDSCYSYMFSGCSSLTEAPELPATTMASKCYFNMFANCYSLTEAPELPATTMAEACYLSMFYGCDSLTEAPELPATTLAEACYSSMFYGCDSLTEAPELPATTLAEACYSSMFEYCKKLTKIPELPATTMAESCYDGMFKNCTSLTETPNLPATTMANFCYYRMFLECTSLTEAPNLPATTLANSCYAEMFLGCTSLTESPELPATAMEEFCYAEMFSGCTSLAQMPSLSASTLANNCFLMMFYNTNIIVKTNQDDSNYTKEWKTPENGSDYWCLNMFSGFTPSLNTVYYVHSHNYVADDNGTTHTCEFDNAINKHHFTDENICEGCGICKAVAENGEHDFDDDGVCKVCEYECTHKKEGVSTFVEGKCSICNYDCVAKEHVNNTNNWLNKNATEHEFACSVCGIVVTGNHDFSQSEYQTDDAGKHYQICALCQAESEKVDCTAGTPVRENVVDATCTVDGSYDEVTYCTLCEQELSRVNKTITKIGHKFTTYTSNDDATCTENATETATCENEDCGETDTREAVNSALGHDYAAEYTVDTNATCTTAGSKSKHCSRCEAKTDITVIPATGEHTYEDGFCSSCQAAWTKTENGFVYTAVANEAGPSVSVKATENVVAENGKLVIPDKVSDGTTEFAVTEIAEKAFENVTGVTEVIIPETVETIGSKAFENEEIRKIDFEGTEAPAMAEDALGTNVTEISVPENATGYEQADALANVIIVKPSASPSPSEEVSASPEPSEEVSVSPSPSEEVSASPQPSEEVSASPSPSNVPSEKPSDEPSVSPSPSEEVSASPEPSEEVSASPSPSNVPSEKPSDEPSVSPSPSEEVSASPEPSEEVSASPEPSEEISASPEPSEEVSASPSPSNVPSEEPSNAPDDSDSNQKVAFHVTFNIPYVGEEANSLENIQIEESDYVVYAWLNDYDSDSQGVNLGQALITKDFLGNVFEFTDKSTFEGMVHVKLIDTMTPGATYYTRFYITRKDKQPIYDDFDATEINASINGNVVKGSYCKQGVFEVCDSYTFEVEPIVATIKPAPSASPSVEPSAEPSQNPSVSENDIPTASPSEVPSETPSEEPSSVPSEEPSAIPSEKPSELPSEKPSAIPSEQPSVSPSVVPTTSPSIVPSVVPSTEPSKAPAVGDVSEDKATNGNYQVTAAETAKKEVTYTKPVNKQKTSYKIPDTVKIDGVVYKITKIEKNAFKNNAKVKTIVAGKNIKSIGANAFKGCKKLKTLTIKSTKLTSGSVAKNAFKGITKATIIKVPKKKLKAYKALFQKKGLSKSVKIKAI